MSDALIPADFTRLGYSSLDFSTNSRAFCFSPSFDRCFLFDLLLRSKFPHVLGDPHRAEVRAAHGTEMCSLRSLLRKGLTKLMPIIFALIGPVVNSSLCRLIPVGSTRIRRVGVINNAVLERERAHPRALSRVGERIGSAHRAEGTWADACRT
jgi:hypothetical protein